MKTRDLLARGLILVGLAGWCGGLVRAGDPFGTYFRAGRWEVYGSGQYMGTTETPFDGPDGTVTVETSRTGLGGLGFGYYFTDNVALRFDAMFGPAQYRFTSTGQAIEHDAFVSTGRVNVDYMFLKKRLTPFATTGIGWQYVSMTYDNLPPTTVCWWDPWWGWICTSQSPTYWETDFSWNVGGGLQWNVTDQFFMRLKGEASWLGYQGSRNLTTQVGVVFSIGVTY